MFCAGSVFAICWTKISKELFDFFMSKGSFKPVRDKFIKFAWFLQKAL